jgi:hypothetical protein
MGHLQLLRLARSEKLAHNCSACMRAPSNCAKFPALVLQAFCIGVFESKKCDEGGVGEGEGELGDYWELTKSKKGATGQVQR